MSRHDVAIIGGGPAGLSAALVLARARWRVAVFDAGTPRNVASPGVQGFLSQDGILPANLRRIAREQIEAYGSVDFHEARVGTIDPRGEGGGFDVPAEGREPIEAALVLLAMGMIDIHPDIDGFRELWGHSIIHCAFCHGWENVDRPWGIVAKSLGDVEGASGFSPWTDDILVFADPGLDIPDDVRRTLEHKGIGIEQRGIRRLIPSADGTLAAVEVEDGEQVPRGTLVYSPEQRQTALVTSVGVELDDQGFVRVDGNRETSIPGIYAAGDLVAGCQDVLSAAAAGAAIAKRMTRLLAAR